jgi:hypothetical protein
MGGVFVGHRAKKNLSLAIEIFRSSAERPPGYFRTQGGR